MPCSAPVALSLSGPRLMRKNQEVERLLRVLFASSDRPLAELFKLKLELDGYWVTVVTTAEAALAEMGRAAQDIVYFDISALTDKQLLGMHALKVNQMMKRIPIVLLSGKHENELADEGVQLGILENLVRVSETVPRDRGALVGEKRLWAS